MNQCPIIRAAIDAAIGAGDVQRIQVGVRTLPGRPISTDPHLVRAEMCFGGRHVERMPGLDDYDTGRPL